MSDQIGQLVERTSPNADDYLVIEDTSETDNFKVKWSKVRAARTAVKTSDETVSSSTTLQDDDELSVTLRGSTTYSFNLLIKFESGGNGGLKWDFSIPTNASGQHGGFGLNGNDATDAAGMSALGSALSMTVGSGSGNGAWGRIYGRISSGDGGTFTFRWAQNSSNATGMVVYNGSSLTATPVG